MVLRDRLERYDSRGGIVPLVADANGEEKERRKVPAEVVGRHKKHLDTHALCPTKGADWNFAEIFSRFCMLFLKMRLLALRFSVLVF